MLRKTRATDLSNEQRGGIEDLAVANRRVQRISHGLDFKIK